MASDSNVRDFLMANIDQRTKAAVDSINSNFRVTLSYHSVFLASLLFLLFIVWDAILHYNLVQVISANLYILGLLVYSICQIIQVKKDVSDTWSEMNVDSGAYFASQVILPCLLGAFMPVFSFFVYHLNRDFGWRIFRVSGGNNTIDRAFMLYHIFLLFLKFSMFFVGAFTVLDIVDTKVTGNGEIIISCAITLLSITVPFLGYFGVRKENNLLMVLFIFAYLGTVGFIADRIYDAFKRGGLDFQRAKIPFIMYAAMSVVLLLGSCISAGVCMRNFHRGLKETLVLDERRKNGEYQAPVVDLDA
ncbi:hypothetical protein BC830DRAFT_1158082 [Chytriomyces sp. MP71]|nr:hypothetical protein BC830DRAFT_1158082 [Chytriomyces sp. MP71]